MLRIRDCLNEGTFVGMLADRTIGDSPAQIVSFLGAPALFPSGPMRVAAALRCEVIFMTGLYRGGNRYHAVFRQLADFSHPCAGGREAAVREGIERYVALVEEYCRWDPCNWFNFYDFWHGAPAPGALAAAASSAEMARAERPGEALRAPTGASLRALTERCPSHPSPVLSRAPPARWCWQQRPQARRRPPPPLPPSRRQHRAGAAAPRGTPPRSCQPFTEVHTLAMLNGRCTPPASSCTTRLIASRSARCTRSAESLLLDHGVLTARRGHRTDRLALCEYPQVVPFVESIRATLAGDREGLERFFALQFSGTLAHWSLRLVPTDPTVAHTVKEIRIEGERDSIHTVQISEADGDASLLTIGPEVGP